MRNVCALRTEALFWFENGIAYKSETKIELTPKSSCETSQLSSMHNNLTPFSSVHTLIEHFIILETLKQFSIFKILRLALSSRWSSRFFNLVRWLLGLIQKNAVTKPTLGTVVAYESRDSSAAGLGFGAGLGLGMQTDCLFHSLFLNSL